MVKKIFGTVVRAVRTDSERRQKLRKCAAIRAAIQGAQKWINELSTAQISAPDRSNSLASLHGARVMIYGIRQLSDPVTPSMEVPSRVLLAYRSEIEVPSVDTFVHMDGYETLWRLVDRTEEELVAVLGACKVSNPHAAIAFHRAYQQFVNRSKK